MNVIDITVEQWLEIQDIEATDDFDRACQIISILRDLPLEEVNELPYQEALQTAQDLYVLSKLIDKTVESVTVDDEELYPIPFESLEFGAFIDLEALFSNEYRDNIHKILATLYRRRLVAPTPLDLPQFEEYSTWVTHRAPLFMQVPIKNVYAVMTKYVSWRNRLLETYSGLFESESNDEPEEGEEGRITSEEAKAIEREKRIKKWGWELFLWKLSGEDPLRMEDATKLGTLHAFNILSMRQELSM